MGEIADIKDKESLEAWLKDQPRETAVWIVSRATLRSMPLGLRRILSQMPTNTQVAEAFSDLRACFIPLVAASNPTERLWNAANKSNEFLDSIMFGYEVQLAATIFAAPYFIDNHASASASEFFWSVVRADAVAAVAPKARESIPLWPDRVCALSNEWQDIAARLRDDPPPGGPWNFWRDWYQGLLDGTPMHPDLLTRIALIDPKDWDAGPERVNPMIHDLRELFELREEAAALRAQKEALLARTASERQRSHNQPPELLDTEPELARKITIVWNCLDEADAELAKKEPDRGRLAEIARRLLAALTAVGSYCVLLGDTALKAGGTAAGTAVGVWIVDHFVNSGRIWDFAKRLLTFAGGG